VRDLPALAIVIVAYRRPELLATTLAALHTGSKDEDFPVTIVDNSSSSEVRDVAGRYGAGYIDAGTNLGFASAVNIALANLSTPGADVLLLNPDAQVGTGTVASLQAKLHAESRLACVAPAQTSPDGTVQRVAWPFPTPARTWLEALGLGRLVRAEDFLIGSVLLLNGAALREVGDLDEAYFLYAEETDWQRRARDAGWGVKLCGELTAVHVGAATSSDDPGRREILFAGAQEMYMRKWYGRSGWACARTAVVLGAVVRAMLLSGERRRAAMRRARHYVAGPSHLAAALGPRP